MGDAICRLTCAEVFPLRKLLLWHCRVALAQGCNKNGSSDF